MIHKLKCIAPFFQAAWDRKKRFEIRINDRKYKVDDIVILREYFPATRTYSGREIEFAIEYLIEGTNCLRQGWCAFSIQGIHKFLRGL